VTGWKGLHYRRKRKPACPKAAFPARHKLGAWGIRNNKKAALVATVAPLTLPGAKPGFRLC